MRLFFSGIYGPGKYLHHIPDIRFLKCLSEMGSNVPGPYKYNGKWLSGGLWDHITICRYGHSPTLVFLCPVACVFHSGVRMK